MSTQQPRVLLGQGVADATALRAETPDEIDASELPNLVSDAVAFHEEDFVDLVGFNEAVNSIIYDASFRGVVVKPANYEKSRAKFYTLHDAYPYLEIDVKRVQGSRPSQEGCNKDQGRNTTLQRAFIPSP
jgi:hypothetical protein